jgi:hypothetical protein
MAIKPKELEQALMPKMPKRPKEKDNETAHKEWQAKAEAGYTALNKIGVEIVREYFKSNPAGVCGSAPWGKLPPDKNLFRTEWEAFVTKLLTTETLKDKNNLKQIKDAIYMGSQQIWLDAESKEDSNLKECASQITPEMKLRLILLKNGDQKRDFILGFFGDKTQKKTFPAFIQALNLNHWSHKKCKPLLRKLERLQAEIQRLKNTPVEDRSERKLPDKPTITAIRDAIRTGMLLEVVENETYYKYMANSSNFAKLSKDERKEILGIVQKWTDRLAKVEEYHEAIDTLHGVIKASILL